MAYLDVAEFTDLTLFPAVGELESIYPGWLAAQLQAETAWIDSRLRKRYAVPFTAPIPDAVKRWLQLRVTLLCYLKRGVDPTDAQYQTIADNAKDAAAEVAEAADAVNGLFDLPLRQDTTATGLTKPAVRVYSEHSPYVSADRQRAFGRAQDRQWWSDD